MKLHFLLDRKHRGLAVAYEGVVARGLCVPFVEVLRLSTEHFVDEIVVSCDLQEWSKVISVKTQNSHLANNEN